MNLDAGRRFHMLEQLKAEVLAANWPSGARATVTFTRGSIGAVDETRLMVIKPSGVEYGNDRRRYGEGGRIASGKIVEGNKNRRPIPRPIWRSIGAIRIGGIVHTIPPCDDLVAGGRSARTGAPRRLFLWRDHRTRLMTVEEINGRSTDIRPAKWCKTFRKSASPGSGAIPKQY